MKIIHENLQHSAHSQKTLNFSFIERKRKKTSEIYANNSLIRNIFFKGSGNLKIVFTEWETR